MTEDDVEMLKSLCEIKSQMDEIPCISDMEVKSRVSYIQKINEMINELTSNEGDKNDLSNQKTIEVKTV